MFLKCNSEKKEERKYVLILSVENPRLPPPYLGFLVEMKIFIFYSENRTLIEHCM